MGAPAADPADVLRWSTYGHRLTSGVQRGNIWGTQCHPEKNHAFGLAPLGGDLLIFGPLRAQDAGVAGVDLPNIRLGGMLPSNALIARLRKDADALYVPMSFAPADYANMTLSFPSKLTDYTAAGLPLLIHGPPTCSAVRWAAENPGAAEVVTSTDPWALADAVGRLIRDPDHRSRLARCAQQVGDRDFSASAAHSRLRAVLARHTVASHRRKSAAPTPSRA